MTSLTKKLADAYEIPSIGFGTVAAFIEALAVDRHFNREQAIG